MPLLKNASTTGGIDFDDLVGNALMSFIMHFLKRLLVGGVHQAKHFRTGPHQPNTL